MKFFLNTEGKYRSDEKEYRKIRLSTIARCNISIPNIEKMRDLKFAANKFIQLVHQLRLREAHQYYSEDIINVENKGAPVIR
ncbi:MAG TPA: hypothetical protein VJ111_01110 [Chitinophagaceae bacterium]|nr:hypothetical protein [Chitinophagaceae bacterium]